MKAAASVHEVWLSFLIVPCFVIAQHSCREMMGRADLSLGHKFFVAFFKHFREVDDALAE